MKTLGFIGCGHMGFAIAKGIKDANFINKEDIYIFDPNESIQIKCKNEGFNVSNNLKDLCQNSNIVFLAVTPQIVDDVLKQIKEYKIDLLVSVVTGASISYMKKCLNNTHIIRTMPNTPLQISYGATALSACNDTNKDELEYIKELFNILGIVLEVDEDKLDLFVGVHGSTPAYFYYFLECLLNDLINRGLNEKDARDFLVQTLIGSGMMLKEDKNKSVSEFVDAVCSKGGTTIQAITHFKENNLQQLVSDANEKCINRAKELSK